MACLALAYMSATSVNFSHLLLFAPPAQLSATRRESRVAMKRLNEQIASVLLNKRSVCELPNTVLLLAYFNTAGGICLLANHVSARAMSPGRLIVTVVLIEGKWYPDGALYSIYTTKKIVVSSPVEPAAGPRKSTITEKYL